MMAEGAGDNPARVVIAGAGFAALEAALALRALGGDQTKVTLVAPDPVFHYRPAATLEAFEQAAPRRYDVREIADRLQLAYERAGLKSVAPTHRSARLSTGARLEYDALVVAIGARARTGISGAQTFRDQRDVGMFRRLVRDMERGTVTRLAFAVPPGTSWPLPLYELALSSAARASARGLAVEISLVSPEPEPLAPFGAEASELVAELLAERGVRFVGARTAVSVQRDGALALEDGGTIPADRVVTVPQLWAHRIPGVPANRFGFIPTEADGRVLGVSDVYAAGDVTTFPLKQGGLAAQQADRVAHAIAASLGRPVRELRTSHVLRAQLLGGEDRILLRTELDSHGRPTSATLERGSEPVPAVGKVFGRYLTPYLETLPPLNNGLLASV